jgi:hypothetical protein
MIHSPKPTAANPWAQFLPGTVPAAFIGVMITTGMLIGPGLVRAKDSSPNEANAVRVGRLSYGQRESECFASRFLALADRMSNADVHDQLTTVNLADAQLFDYPMVVMSGKGRFELSKQETDHLGRYLRRGGFVLASTTCADADWSTSFREMVELALPELTWRPIEPGHAMMNCLYQVDSIRTVRRVEQPLLGGSIDGRLVLVFSPVDLRDAESLGPDCCCCGANAIINARYINANALVYALMP